MALGLVWWLLGGRTIAAALYVWNPLVLFDLVGSTHNDVLADRRPELYPPG